MNSLSWFDDKLPTISRFLNRICFFFIGILVIVILRLIIFREEFALWWLGFGLFGLLLDLAVFFVFIIAIFIGYRRDLARKSKFLQMQGKEIPFIAPWQLEFIGLFIGAVLAALFIFLLSKNLPSYGLTRPFHQGELYYVYMFAYSYVGLKLSQFTYSLFKLSTISIKGLLLVFFVLILTVASPFLLSFQQMRNDQAKDEKIREGIKVDNFRNGDPTVERSWFNNYGSTKIIFTVDLYIPVDGDYSISADLDSKYLTVTTDAGKHELFGTFHLTEGWHPLKLTHLVYEPQFTCPDNKTYESDSPKTRRLAITITSWPQGTKFPSIYYETKPYKESDFYLHCKDVQ